MKQLNKIQNAIYIAGALMLLLGTMLCLPKYQFAPIIYSIGAVCFVSMQLTQRYEGKSFVVRRLRRQQIISGVLLLLTSIPMFMNYNPQSYFHHNEWILLLTIAAILQLYTAFRIPAEIAKEESKGKR